MWGKYPIELKAIWTSVPSEKIQWVKSKHRKLMCGLLKTKTSIFLGSKHNFGTLLFGIVRPVKRDWAVLSKDTPMDISISKSVRQGVFIHL